MKFHSLAVLLALGSWGNKNDVSAFVPSSSQLRTSASGSTRLMMASGNDVSVPYDAAARLAYDEWRIEFKKGDFDHVRFEQFKNNYEALTAANMAAKKEARDKGTETVDLLTLNEYGDFSAEEYEAMQSGDEARKPTTSADIMGKAAEAAEAQADASNALGEAADALAEEEEVSIAVPVSIGLCVNGVKLL